MKIPGSKIDFKVVRKKYDTEKAVYVKYGQEIPVTEFVDKGRDGTEAKKIIGKTVNMDELRKITKDIPSSDVVINMNLDPYMANKLMKTSKIAYERIMAQAKEQEKLKQEQEKPKGDNVNAE